MTNPKHTDTSRSGDLVERLRERTCVVFNSPGVHPDTECLEAADRIEALEVENARLREAVQAQKAERIRGGEMVKEAAAIRMGAHVWMGHGAAAAIRALSVPAIVEAGDA